jgi:hypothetical protein
MSMRVKESQRESKRVKESQRESKKVKDSQIGAMLVEHNATLQRRLVTALYNRTLSGASMASVEVWRFISRNNFSDTIERRTHRKM